VEREEKKEGVSFRSLSYLPFSLLFLLFLLETLDTKAKESYLLELCRGTQNIFS